jgi:hypothetical protein
MSSIEKSNARQPSPTARHRSPIRVDTQPGKLRTTHRERLHVQNSLAVKHRPAEGNPHRKHGFASTNLQERTRKGRQYSRRSPIRLTNHSPIWCVMMENDKVIIDTLAVMILQGAQARG